MVVPTTIYFLLNCQLVGTYFVNVFQTQSAATNGSAPPINLFIWHFLYLSGNIYAIPKNAK